MPCSTCLSSQSTSCGPAFQASFRKYRNNPRPQEEPLCGNPGHQQKLRRQPNDHSFGSLIMLAGSRFGSHRRRSSWKGRWRRSSARRKAAHWFFAMHFEADLLCPKLDGLPLVVNIASGSRNLSNHVQFLIVSQRRRPAAAQAAWTDSLLSPMCYESQVKCRLKNAA
jgi:hypothetical protein